MNNFTRSGGRAKIWQSITNLSCCSIDLITKQTKSMKAIAFIMLFMFSIGTMLGQSAERTTFLNRCMSEAPNGPSISAVAMLYEEQCEGIEPEITKTTFWDPTSTDCEWFVEYTYDIKCGEIADEIKIVYYGGDASAPSLEGELPGDQAGLNLCFSAIPEGPSESEIAALYSDNCSEVTVVKSGSPSGTDCEWNVTYTYTITDACGNAAEEVKVEYSGGDTEAPTLDPKAKVPTGASNLNLCFENKAQGPTEAEIAALFTDNCSEVIVVKESSSKGTDCTWKASYTYNITDACGNAAEPIVIAYSGGDTEAPVFNSLPDDITVNCIDEIGNAPKLYGTDNCDSDVKPDLVEVDDSGLGIACEGGVLIRTWVLEDACGNSTTTSQTVTVLPAPKAEFLNLPEDMTLSCADADNYQIPSLAYSNGVSQGACALNGEVPGELSGEFDKCGGELQITWSFEDECGYEISHTQTITVEPAPTASFDEVADIIIDCENLASYTAQPLAYSNYVEGSEVCLISGSAEPEVEAFEGSCGSFEVSYSYTDECGNTITAGYTVTVEDNKAPELSDAMDMTVECDGQGNAAELEAWLANHGGATATDNCGNITWSNNFDGLSDLCGATGSATVEFTATDDCGNESKTTATFTIEDTTPPVIDPPADYIKVECDGQGNVDSLQYWLDNNGSTAIAVDDCSDVTWSNDFEGLVEECGATGYALVTFTATDACGNSSSTTAQFTIEDTLPPTITDAMDMTVDCDGQGNVAELEAWLVSNGGATGSDECSGIEWTNNFNGLSDDCGATGSATVEFTATDDCGNYSKTTATFTIQDVDSPPITVEAQDMTVECDGQGNVEALEAWLASNGGAEAYDLCSEISWSNNFDGLSDDCGATGSATVLFTVMDECGLSSSTSATFTIVDTTAPEFEVEAMDMTVECDGQGNVEALEAWLASNGGAYAYDTCSDVEWSNNFDALSDLCGATGSATVEFTATDDCGNESKTTATFTIEDTTNPSIDNAAEALTVECDGAGNTADLEAWLANNGGALASDGCSDVTWSNDFVALSDDCGATGEALVVFIASDDCGNTSKTSAIFKIIDSTSPDITDAMDMTVECDGQGNGAELEAWLANNGGATASDICSDVTWSNNFEALSDDCGATGSATVEFTATDDCGNESKTTATFTIEDTTNPTIEEAKDETVECDGQGNVEALQAWLANNGGASASDTCGGVTWSNNFEALSDDCGSTGSATVEFTATDDCGNESKTTATFTIEDTTDPEITDAMDQTVECSPGEMPSCEYTIVLTDSFGDGWNGATLTVSVNGSVVLDAISFGSGTLSDPYSFGVTGGNSITATYNTTGIFPSEIGYIIYDSEGNEVYTEASSNANPDLEGLTASCPGEGSPSSEAQFAAWLANNGGATASDLCGEVTWTNNSQGLSDECGNTGSETVEFTATDACGNTSKTTATFTIVDTTDPTIDVAAEDETVECGPGNTGSCTYYIQLFDSFNDGWQGDLLDVAVNGEVVLDDLALTDLFQTGNEPVPGEYDPIPFAVTTGDAVITIYQVGTFSGEASWVVTDSQGNVVGEGDGSSPINLTANCEVASSDELYAMWIANNGGAQASDLCGEITWSNDATGLSDECGNTGSETVTFTATDECGNTSSTTATFTIIDTTAPTIDAEAMDMTVECDGEGNDAQIQEWLNNVAGALASDTCGDVVWSNNYCDYSDVDRGQEVPNCVSLSDDCGATGSVTVTFTATDDCGNTSTTSATFTIEDTINPEIDTPSEDLTVECDGTGNGAELEEWLTTNGGATAKDDCSDVVWSNDFEGLSDDCGATGSATVTFTATDDCGNFSTTTSTFTIIDSTPPVVTDAMDQTVECDGSGNQAELAAWLANNGGATAEDLCGDVTWSNNCENPWLGFMNVTDLQGNYQFGAPWQLQDLISIVNSETNTLELKPNRINDLNEYWINPDGSGNKIMDASTYVQNDSFLGQGFSFNGTVTSNTLDDSYTRYAFIRIFTADYSSVQEYQSPIEGGAFSIEVDGSYAPEGGHVQYGFNVTGLNVNPLPEYDEAHAALGSVVIEAAECILADDCGATGSTTVTFTATDSCGNTSSTTATFTIVDTTAPTITEATDETVECDGEGNVEALEAWLANNGGATAADDCSDVTWSNNFDALSDDCGATGSATVEFTATDDCGNSSKVSATFTIVDTIAPSITSAYDETVECDGEGNLAQLEAWLANNGGATAEDTCSDVVWSNNFTELSDDCAATGSATVEFTATDDCGNSSKVSATFTIVDTTAPVMVGPAPQGESNLDLCFENRPTGPSIEEIAALYEEECGEVVVIKEEVVLGDDCDWAVMYRYLVADECGNEVPPVKVYYNGKDQSAPVLVGTLPTGTTGLQCLSENPGGPKASDLEALYTDNCGTVIVTELDPVVTGDDCGWSATYTFTVQDACGNYAETIVITNSGADTTPPVLEGTVPMGQNSLDLCIDSNLNEPKVEEIAALYSDNCGGEVTVTVEEKVYGTDCEWIRVFEYTAMDACGNEADIVKVNYQGGDQSAPEPTGFCTDETMILYTSMGTDCPADSGTSLQVGDEIDVNTDWSVGGIYMSQLNGSLAACFTDNCAAVEELTFRVMDVAVDTSDSCSSLILITFDVEDKCENVYKDFVCTFAVIDDTAPVVECPEGQDFGVVTETPTGFADKAPYTDNCQAPGQTQDYMDSEITENQVDNGIEYSFTRTFTANDGCGNEASCDVTYTWTILSTGSSCGYEVVECGSIVTGDTSDQGAEDEVIDWSVFYDWANPGEGSHTGNWYTFVGTGEDVVAFSTCNNTNYDSRIIVTTGCGDNLVVFANNDDSCGLLSFVEFFAEAGVEYNIFVTGFATYSVGEYQLNVSCDPAQVRMQMSEPTSEVKGEEALDFTAYPVPFDKVVNIAYEFDFDTDVTIELYDTKGLLVLSETNSRYVKGSKDKTTFDLSRTANQMFYVKLTTSQGSVTKKIVSSSPNRR